MPNFDMTGDWSPLGGEGRRNNVLDALAKVSLFVLKVGSDLEPYCLKWAMAFLWSYYLICMLLGAFSRRSSCFACRSLRIGRAKSLKLEERRMTTSKIVECDDKGIEESAAILQAGGLVAFPTETVYGLGANALNESSVQSIFLAKKRPPTDPLIVHVLSKDNIYDLFDFDRLVCDTMGKPKAQVVCELLCDLFWPGPLTIIFKAKAVVPGAVTSGTGFVGLRSPRHAIARKLLQAAKLPIAAPSANRFGHVSPTSPEHVMEDLGMEGIAILRDDVASSGGCKVGIESTVCKVSPSGNEVSILRCGAVTASDISAALQEKGKGLLSDLGDGTYVRVSTDNEKALKSSSGAATSANASALTAAVHGTVGNGADVVIELAAGNTQQDNIEHEGAEGAVAPGQMIRHYAPDIPTYIVLHNPTSSSTSSSASSSSSSANVECINQQLRIIGGLHSPVSATDLDLPTVTVKSAFIIDFGGKLRHLRSQCAGYEDLSPAGNTAEACEHVFRLLRYTESEEVRVLGVETVLLPDLRAAAESDELLRALWERLHRAASGTFVE